MADLSVKDLVLLTIIFAAVSYCYKNFDAPVIDFMPAENIRVEYWNGDLNCPIFTARDDGSMVAFNLKSARKSDKKFQDGNALIIFDGYEIEFDGSYNAFGEYALLYNERANFYYVFYPRSRRFPEGAQFQIENIYQTNVCRKLIRAVDKFRLLN